MYVGNCILQSLGLGGSFTLKINTLGIAKEREKYIFELTSFFEERRHLLDETDRARLDSNPLRLLDTKNPDTRELLAIAPKLTDFLKKDSAQYYEQVKEYLTIL
jgi:histidyl-tRNA synthetase